MIARIWHGWTSPENSDQYEAMLKEEIFVGIKDRNIEGFLGIQLLRREVNGEIEFMTLMKFDSLDSVREFAGEDYDRAVVYEKAKQLMLRYDDRSQHYDILV
jgi:heme-degrading monooxygenase HmoA